jgi:mono/diheme cytochrome c family protein
MSQIARCTFAAAGLLLLAACTQQAPPPPAASQPPPVSPVERGRYLVSIAACDDCHTPAKMGPIGPEPDMSRRLSGHPENQKVDKPPKLGDPWMFAGTWSFTAFAGPWGISYTANLTSDKNTGIGQDVWTEELFIKAIREGKHIGTSRPILPPMPWPVYRNMTDDDLKAVFAYLRTVPAVNNHVPEPIINEPPKK